MRLRRAAPALVLLPLLALMCATATEIDVDIYSEVDCTKNAEVGVVLGGKLTDLGMNALSSTAVHCDQSERVGRVVITPSGDHDEEIAFAVVTRNDDQALDSCTEANNYKGCIVARRQLRFEARTALDVRVDLRLDCLDRPCEPDSTCVMGGCFSATCPASGCATESVLAAGFDGGPPTSSTDSGSNETSVPDDATTATPEASIDAGAKCPAPAASAAGAHIVVPDTSTVAIPTGLGFQNHLFFAANDCRYWYFWIDAATTNLHTMISTDLVKWDKGSDIVLGSNAVFGTQMEVAKTNGANFSVAYHDFNGVDTFHVVIDQPSSGPSGQTGYPFDVRFTLAGASGSATPTPAILHQIVPTGHGLSGGSCQNTDGPSVAYSSDGHVYIASGWYSDVRGTHCDNNVYISADAETGTGNWATTFSWSGYFVTAHYTMAHLLIPLAGKQTMYGAFPEPETAAGYEFTNAGWITDLINWDGGYGDASYGDWPNYPNSYDTNTANDGVFSDTGGNTAGSDDWNVCITSPTDGHAIRRYTDGSFEARKLTASGWELDTSLLGALSASATQESDVYGRGLVIMSDGDPAHGLSAFATTGPDTQIMVSNYSAAGWSPWQTLVSTSVATTRKWLSGTGCTSSRPILTWTAAAAAQTSIMAMDVSSSFKPK